MKILILPSWYPDKDNELNGIFFKLQAEALKKKHFDVSVIAISQVGNPLKYAKVLLKKVETENDILVIRKNAFKFPRIKLFEMVFYKRAILVAFKLYLKKNPKPDIVHAHSVYPGGFGAYLLKRHFKIPYVITEHSSNIDKIIKSKPDLIKKIVCNADSFISVSNFLKHTINQYYRTLSISVIPNMVNFDRNSVSFSEKVDNTGASFNFVNISLIAENENKKGLDVLIKAMKLIVYRYQIKDIKLILIGNGGTMKIYSQMIDEYHLKDFVICKGPLNHLDTLLQIKQNHALIISSRIETFGIVGIEALYLGKPVVATKCGGPEDYVTPAVGLLVNKEDVQALANGMIQLKKDYKKYNPAILKNWVETNFSENVICNKLKIIYSEIL